MSDNFNGITYRLANNWFDNVNIDNYKDKPINYLEIGTFYGANILSVAKTYGIHSGSKLYCIDPWEDYNDYPEYKNEQSTIYNYFINNIENSGVKDKIIINRGYSNLEIPKFQDDFFDIIYIDGNHEPEYVLEDAVLSFRKLKQGGIMIFDDYGWGGPDLTQKGIDGFLSGYHKKITYLGERASQVFIQKKDSIMNFSYGIEKFSYGIENCKNDITHYINSFLDNNILNIPHNDHERSTIFGDPAPGKLKRIYCYYRDYEEINIFINCPIKISYGTRDNNIDVTKLALEKCMNGNVLFIPRGDHDRACLFSDPLPGTLKYIYIELISN